MASDLKAGATVPQKSEKNDRSAAPKRSSKEGRKALKAPVALDDESLYEAVRCYLQEKMQQKGQKLETELQLAARFGVTRYKLRKALARLDRTGILKRVKHAGSEVASLDPTHLATDLHFRLSTACGEDEFADARLWFLDASVKQWTERVTPSLLSDLQGILVQLSTVTTDEEANTALRNFWVRLVSASGNRVVETMAGALFLPARAVTQADAALWVERLAKVVNALRKRDDGKLKKAVLRTFKETIPSEDSVDGTSESGVYAELDA